MTSLRLKDNYDNPALPAVLWLWPFSLPGTMGGARLPHPREMESHPILAVISPPSPPLFRATVSHWLIPGLNIPSSA